MEIRFYVTVIRRGWWLILISVLVAVNASLVYSYYITTPMYEAVARFIVSPNIENIEGRDLVNSIEALDKRSIISTYAEVLNSRQIIEDTFDLLGLSPEIHQQYTTSVAVLPDANILRFSVRGPDPEMAAVLANSIGQNAIDFIRRLYVVYDIDFLDKAVPPIQPYHPKPLQNATLALLFGAVVGVGLAIFREQLASTVEQLSRRKMYDGESQAYTRAHFERSVRDEFALQPESVFTLAFIRLNGIQDIYDSLPQVYINRVMRWVRETLREQLRGNDLVGRWSTLQFSVLLPATDGAAAELRMERICEVLNQPFSLDEDGESTIRLDPRIGLADRKGGEAFNVLVEQAEQALEIAMESDKKVFLYKVRPFG